MRIVGSAFRLCWQHSGPLCSTSAFHFSKVCGAFSVRGAWFRRATLLGVGSKRERVNSPLLPQAYSPLCKARKLEHPVVVALAQKLGITPAQLLIRWGMGGCWLI